MAGSQYAAGLYGIILVPGPSPNNSAERIPQGGGWVTVGANLAELLPLHAWGASCGGGP